MPTLTSVKIFPPIGIARLGNSQEWFLGPELPFPAPPTVPADGHYKDNQCRIRRQAQRFRLWGYFDTGPSRELTLADGTIQWTVHLANAKPVFRGEAGGLIDPGARTLTGANDSATFANGTYTYNNATVEVPLGSAETDQDGRLIVAGGFGFSNSPAGNALTTWLDNAGWHDDVSDGPVNATIQVGGQVFTATGAWVICPPPRYAPGTYAVVSLYDTLRQRAIDLGLLAAPGQPSFVNDIWPILRRGIGMTRVAAGAFGPGDHGSLAGVIPPGTGQDATRAAILGKLASPASPGNVGQANQPANMPLLNSGGTLPILDETDVPPTLRKFQYDQMNNWSAGNFVNDWPAVAPTVITPDGLTRAALENCIGAPFFPGIEATLTVRDGSITYSEAFRFDQTHMSPGDVTKAMARPWQTDFTACSGGDTADAAAWWPSARPDSVYTPGTTTPVEWTRGLVSSYQDMVDNWFRLGFIVDPGDGKPVETERNVVCKDCYVVTDRNEIGKEEATALVTSGQPIIDGFFAVVEGFAPSDLGITTASPSPMQLQAWAPAIALNPMPAQMQVAVNDMLLEDNSALTIAQRITFGYNIRFSGTNDFTAAVVPITVTATIQTVSGSAVIDLTPIDSPYMDHGPISWLSNDTRVFKLQPMQSVAGVTLGNDPIGFIQALIMALRTQTTPAQIQQNYTTFENLNATESGSDLEWLPTLNNQPVYNFALCRVRYRATVTAATDVRVFFRAFQTAATGTEYNPNTTYRVGGHPGVRIPLLGIQGGELVTIPFFAEARKANTINLNQQSDDTNKQTIQPGQNGQEAYAYFGCWLDINQPNDKRFPIQPSPADGGPFTGTLQSVADLIRGSHQCLVSEINFDPDPIVPVGVSTAASQKLSQRNLAIDDSDNPGNADAHRVQHTFAIHPTTTTPLPTQGPDELMIVWGNTPLGTPATLFLPGVRASEVLDLAARRFNLQTLTRVDDHTLGCTTGGVTYVPIPASAQLDLAGLITLDLPLTVRTGQTFRIVLRQVVDTPAPVAGPPPVPQIAAAAQNRRPARRGAAVARPGPASASTRHITGAFQFSILVKTARDILPRDERTIVSLKRVLNTVPAENRWHPVLTRYLSQLTTRVIALGGPGTGGPGEGGSGPGRDPDHDHGRGERASEHRVSYEGKVAGIRFDRFGDFEGFSLDTEEGRRRFSSRERNVERLVQQAWSERIAILVTAERETHGGDEQLREIVLLRRPVGS